MKSLKTVTAGCLLLSSSLAFAYQDSSDYTYLDLAVISATIENQPDLDGLGLALDLSFDIAEIVALQAGYEKTAYEATVSGNDIEVDVGITRIGALAHYSFIDELDGYLGYSQLNSKSTTSVNGNEVGDSDNDATRITLGLKYRVTDAMSFDLAKVQTEPDGGDTLDGLSVGLNSGGFILKYETDMDGEDQTKWSIGGRIRF